MALAGIILLIFALYLRTINYHYVIDDYIPRSGYPHPPKEATNPKFFLGAPPVWYRLAMITMHAVNASIIYMIWGWQAALIFAVHPMGIWGTAWVTGNYYATTAYFTLIAFYFMHTFPIWGMVPAAVFYLCALNSTFDALPFPFIFMFVPPHWGTVLLAPMAWFMSGKKFQEGLKSRMVINEGKHISHMDFPLRRISVMVKTMARYIYCTLVPMKVRMFDKWAENTRDYQDVYDQMHQWNKEFWASLALCSTVFVAGLCIHPLGTFWFFVFMGLHSQFNLLGQPFAQRYIYLPLIGMCVVVGTALTPVPWMVFTIAGFLACKTHYAILPWRNQEELLTNEMHMNPERGDSYNTLAQFYMSIQKLENYERYMVNYVSYLVRKSTILDPRSWTVRMNLAAYLLMIGMIDQGIEESYKTIELLKKVASKREEPLIAAIEDQIQRFKNIKIESQRQHELQERENQRRIIL